MSEQELELLITLDDPEGAPEEDTFHHTAAENTLEHWLDQPPRNQPASTSRDKQEK
jgi:hypothetical protein